MRTIPKISREWGRIKSVQRETSTTIWRVSRVISEAQQAGPEYAEFVGTHAQA
jgi:hypothetical protein